MVAVVAVVADILEIAWKLGLGSTGMQKEAALGRIEQVRPLNAELSTGSENGERSASEKLEKLQGERSHKHRKEQYFVR